MEADGIMLYGLMHVLSGRMEHQFGWMRSRIHMERQGKGKSFTIRIRMADR